jgi:DNA-binding response OmpR family regulator
VTSDSPGDGERTRILIVPDGLLGTDLRETYLDRQSLTVKTAEDAKQGLTMAELWRPHLIVFRGEPGEDKNRFAALRPELDGPGPKLIMVTDRLQEHGGAADAACDAHLVGPLVPEQLLATIAEVLDIPRRRSERVPIDVLVHTEGFEGDVAEPSSTLSSGLFVSEEGMLVEASRQLSLHARGQLQFFLPNFAERLTLEGVARVAVDEIRLIYVIEFVDLAPQHRALIRRYVESQKEVAA